MVSRLVDTTGPGTVLFDPLDNYGRFLSSTGQIDAALQYYEQAPRGPFSVDVGWKKVQAYGARGDFEAAFAEAERDWASRRNLPIAGLNAALASRDRKRIDTALQRLAATGGVRGLNAQMATLLDEPERALRILRDELAGSDTAPEPFVLNAISTWAAYFRDPALSLAALQKIAAPEKYELVTMAIWGPFSSELRGQPAFEEIVGDLGLVSYWREWGWPDVCHPVGSAEFACDQAGVER